MKNTPIFSELFLSKFLYDFRLSSIPNIRLIKEKIELLIKELQSGKIDSLKEEEVKSRFVTTFFGDILNFNYGNADAWMLREEKKSLTDGSKPDAVLGYFYADKQRDDVRVVIEVKDARTSLDEKQKRINSASPVDQGFSYAHKTGGGCRWVVVTNIREIRFYTSSDSSKYQVYLLEKLNDESKLKELLFLFHKDNFIKSDRIDKSNTDKLLEISESKTEKKTGKVHIIDKMYHSLKRFEDFGFVNPDYIASIKPFNILDEYVWHYRDSILFTINEEIYDLINGISIIESKIIFSDSITQDFADANVDSAEEKLRWCFTFLNKCLITEIQAVKDYQAEFTIKKALLNIPKTHIFSCQNDNIIRLEINIRESNNVCDCLICNYRNFDFERLIKKLKKVEASPDYYSMEYAFGNYLLSSNDYRTPYFILNEIRNKVKTIPEKGVTYFLATLNIKFLYNQVRMSTMGDTGKIRSEIRAIDLDKLLYSELEFYVEREVLDYLKKVKEDDLIHKVQENVEELFEKINDLKILIDEGGSQTGPNYAYNLLNNYEKCYLHHYHNGLFYLKFQRYNRLSERVLKALLVSYNTDGYGLLYFTEFVLTESILNIPNSKLKKILLEQQSIEVDSESLKKLMVKLKNLLSSYVKKSFFNDFLKNEILSSQLQNWEFQKQYSRIFANTFAFLSVIDIKKKDFSNIAQLLINFLEVEDTLAHFDLKMLEDFIFKRGDLFEDIELESILNIAIRRTEIHNLKYEGLLQSIPETFIKYRPLYKYSNLNLTRRLLLNCEREDGSFTNYKKAIYLAQVSNESCREILVSAFRGFLEKNFDVDFYELLLHAGVLEYSESDYLEKYVLYANTGKSARAYKYGNLVLTSYVYLGFINLISKLHIDVNQDCFGKLKDLNDFERWLLDPVKFNYQKFDCQWLIEIDGFSYILRKMSNIPEILLSVEKSLELDFNPVLAKIKYRYLILNEANIEID